MKNFYFCYTSKSRENLSFFCLEQSLLSINERRKKCLLIKKGLLFTTLMCFLMVFGMSTYNLLLHGEFSLYALSKGLLPGFIVAFILDVFVVGVLAKKIAFSLPFNKEKRLLLILTISSFMIIGMVTCMSLFGLLMESQMLSLSAYFQAWGLNFIVALPYQLLIVGPFSRMILTNYQQRQT